MSELLLSELKELFLIKLSQQSPAKNKGLNEAINYALQGKGKRLRPMMVLTAALSCEKNTIASALKLAMPAALAVEYIHTYSLIHDDLPCMDDDDYRRGRPSLHRRFGEALAILSADALIADAFYLVAKAQLNPSAQCAELAEASGRHGLVLGQCEDLEATALSTHEHWHYIHAAKTARLFEACSVLGALSQGLPASELGAYRLFGHHFGMAFQLKDDIDDQAGLKQIMSKDALLRQLSFHTRAMQQALEAMKDPKLLLKLLDLSALGAEDLVL